jgi:hypothetical protein
MICKHIKGDLLGAGVPVLSDGSFRIVNGKTGRQLRKDTKAMKRKEEIRQRKKQEDLAKETEKGENLH